jgi:hypothetical protein
METVNPGPFFADLLAFTIFNLAAMAVPARRCSPGNILILAEKILCDRLAGFVPAHRTRSDLFGGFSVS